MIRITTVVDGIEDELERLINGPTLQDLLAFETVLLAQFSATQVAVHRITQSLALSAKLSSDYSNDKWTGNISYGGSSTGIHNPVDYAEYEREREGSHDFLAPAVRMEDDYIQALNKYLGG